MKQGYCILRHITKKEYLNSIITSGALKGEFVRRNGDRGYLSFELNPTTNTLLNVFHLLKEWEATQSFELIFDRKQLLQAGYEIHSTIDGKHYSKIEIDIVMKAKGEKEVSEEIGDFVFIRDNVPLKFLTSDSKIEIENWARENNINEAAVKLALYN